MIDKELIFDIILMENAKYMKLIIDESSTQMEQEVQLQICSTMFEDLVLRTGLVKEYAEYCEIKKWREQQNG